MSKMRDYTKIKAWQHADELTVMVYRASRGFPRDEVYGLTSQLRRSAYSVPANIAEGSARESKKDYLHFLYIARGPLSECQYFIHLASRLDYLGLESAQEVKGQLQETFQTLHGLFAAVEKESGKLTRVAAGITSALALCLIRLGLSFKGL